MSAQKMQTPPEPLSELGNSSWDRMVEDWRRRPRFYISWLLAIAVIGAAGIIFWQQRTSAAEETLDSYSDALVKALGEVDAADRVSRMQALEPQATGEEWEPTYWVRYAEVCRQAGDEAPLHTDKIRYYKQAIGAVDRLVSTFPDNPMVVLPWKPNAPGTDPKPSFANGLRQYCSDQVAFLEEHPFERLDTPDKNLSATIEVEDPEGTKHTLKLSFFSKLAPASVDTWCRMAREGQLAGTLVFGLEREKFGQPSQGGTDQLIGFHLGSAMSRVAPEDDTLWGDMKKDRVGFTVPGEPSSLEYERGRVALEWYQDALGSSPMRCVVFTKAPRFSGNMRRTIFAEITEGLDACDRIMTQETDPSTTVSFGPTRKLERLEKPWKVVGVTVEGEADRKPDVPIASEPRLPEAPKKKEPEKKGEDQEDGR